MNFELLDITVPRGGTYVHAITLLGADGLAYLNDFTGWEAEVQVREDGPASAQTYRGLSTGGSPALVFVGNVLTWTVPATTTLTWLLDEYDYELQIKKTSDGFVAKIYKGALNVEWSLIL